MLRVSRLLNKKNISYLFLSLLTFNLILASLGGSMANPIFLSFCFNLFFWGLLLYAGINIKLPRYFKIYLLFLITGLTHYFFFGGNLKLFIILVSGAVYWITAHNLKDEIAKHIPWVIRILSIVMALFLFANIGKDLRSDVSENLFHPTATSKHNHIGDVFAVAVVPSILDPTVGFKPFNIFFSAISLFFVAFSFSRSAVVSLIFSVLFVYLISGHKYRQKMVLNIIFILGLCLIVYFGTQKTTIFSRPYFAESLGLLIKNPWGIGFGNFPKYYPGVEIVHSLIVEIVVGYGVFATIGIYWIYLTLKQVVFESRLESKNGANIALFIAIVTNLAFDRTYLIPTFIWLMFVILGVIERGNIKARMHKLAINLRNKQT